MNIKVALIVGIFVVMIVSQADAKKGHFRKLEKLTNLNKKMSLDLMIEIITFMLLTIRY